MIIFFSNSFQILSPPTHQTFSSLSKINKNQYNKILKAKKKTTSKTQNKTKPNSNQNNKNSANYNQIKKSLVVNLALVDMFSFIHSFDFLKNNKMSQQLSHQSWQSAKERHKNRRPTQSFTHSGVPQKR